MREYLVEKPVTITDELNFETNDYKSCGKKLIYLVLQDRSVYKQNEFAFKEITMVGYTKDATIQEGYLIDKKYKVEKVIPHRDSFILYLNGIENGI